MNPSEESKLGCLGKVLKLLGISLEAKSTEAVESLPYLLRDDFLSPAERSFYGVLVTALGPSFVICPKVNVADILYVTKPNANHKYRNKIAHKHVDFLVCNASTMSPRLAVELDDASHDRADRRERDEFMNLAFAAADFPLLHVPARQSYNTGELKESVEQALKHEVTTSSTQSSSDSTPQCPKCGIPLVKRVAKQGDQAGQVFWGCTNYPKCRQTVTMK